MGFDARSRSVRALARISDLILRRLPGAVGDLGIYFSAMGNLAAGRIDLGWERDSDALLRRSDVALARNNVDGALRWFDKAARLRFHTSLHATGHSPLVADAEMFLRHLRESAVGSLLIDTPPSATLAKRPAPRALEARESLRLLVIVQQNWTFIRPVIAALRATGRVEVHELEVDTLPADQLPTRERILRGRWDLASSGTRMPTPQRLIDEFAWADVALVEWSHHILTWATLLDHAPRALLTRLHGSEAFTPFPLMNDYTALDLVLYVSPPIRNLVASISPGFASTDSWLVGNLLSHGLGEPPDRRRDRHLLVQIGWASEIKDVLFTLDVLEGLREHDQRYRLQLVGSGLPDDAADDNEYQREVRERLAMLPGVVEILGYRRDIPEILGAAGHIISSSRREGTHESVMEGLAMGCVPVIRDWPDAAPFGGAASLYEPDWVVRDVDAAVRRVLEVHEHSVWQECSSAARAWVIERRSPDYVVSEIERALRSKVPLR